MTNTLPVIPNCPHPATHNAVCAAAAKAKWVADNALADAAYAAAKLLADGELAKRLDVYESMVRPDGWTDYRWARRKMRVRHGAYGLYDLALSYAANDREASYEGNNEAYVAAMAACCEGNA